MKKLTLAIFSVIILITNNAFARPAPESFADLVETLTPTVVNISTSQTVKVNNSTMGQFEFNFPEGAPFEDLPDLFEKFYGNRGGDMQQEKKATALGSGFIIDADGYVVTNNHVIDGAESISVILSDNTTLEAKIVGRDAKTDIALLKVEAGRKLPTIKWGNSDKARVGDWVIAIGNPFGLGGSVSAGIISARARDINVGPFDDFIQTDAAINRGNSGGPLFNSDGELIGINTAIFSPSGGNVGIGFSVPSSMVLPIIDQLKKFGRAQRGWLGVKIQTVTEEIAESIGLKKAEGALVLEVMDKSPAAEAGIVAGDVIMGFDGKDITAMKKLPRVVAETSIGKKVAVTIWRKEKMRTVVVKIAELKEDDSTKTAQADDGSAKKEERLEKAEEVINIEVAELNADLRKKYNIADDIHGIFVSGVKNDSVAYQKGLRRGDIISTVNQEAVETIAQFKKLVDESKSSGRKSVLLLVNKPEQTEFIAVPVE